MLLIAGSNWQLKHMECRVTKSNICLIKTSDSIFKHMFESTIRVLKIKLRIHLMDVGKNFKKFQPE